MTINKDILALPRRERRKAYLAAYRKDKSTRWDPYRRFATEPVVFTGEGWQKFKAAAKERARQLRAAFRTPKPVEEAPPCQN